MSLTLQVLNGHRYGESITLEATTSIGRLADISFDDVKMSKVHVIFELDRLLGWFVKDQGSKNGLVVNGERTSSHLLEESDLVEVGATQLRVASVSAFWKPQLNQVLIDAFDSVRNEPLTMYAFRLIPLLRFVQGVQTGQEFVLEYGPRKVGGETDDILLYEPLCPDLAFEISANNQGIWFKTKYPKIVSINNKQSVRKLLKKGDRIKIHNTIIEVDFLNI
ncbi:MAG: FHA domain-containing protein [Bdellovibrionaceae bacterium]|nr:FHA domain-containing protein [Pseudobdellovibrionaceae bacterium]